MALEIVSSVVMVEEEVEFHCDIIKTATGYCDKLSCANFHCQYGCSDALAEAWIHGDVHRTGGYQPGKVSCYTAALSPCNIVAIYFQELWDVLKSLTQELRKSYV